MFEFKIKQIILKSGVAIAVATFNKGYSHIIVDDHCWAIVNGGNMSAWIFKEALEVLKQLPDSPSDYEPYKEFIKDRG